MRNKVTFMLMALGVALPVMSLQAADSADQPERPQRGPRGDRPVPGVFGALDTNRDRKLDKAEINGATEALKKLDKDSDGKLTMAELRGGMGRGPRAEAGQGERPNRERRGERGESEERAGQRRGPGGEGGAERPVPGGMFVATLDANKNRTIDAEELTGAPAALLKLDKNSDGELTMDELQMVRGPRGERRPGATGRGAERGERPDRGARGAGGAAADKE